MRVAVFGDVHGNLPAMYDYVQRWEASFGQEVDLVLQAGDLGVFPDLAKLDKATRDHAKKDKTELLASLYVDGRQEATHKTYFVRGNHEDFGFLRNCKGGPIDPLGRIVQVDASEPMQIGEGQGACLLAGLGGIQPPGHLDHDVRGQLGAKYYAPQEVDALLNHTTEPVDILLTHDGPLHPGLDRQGFNGSATVLRIIERLQPRFHFFAHYSDPPPPFEVGRTQVIPLNQADVLHLPNRDGGMGILDTETWEFDFVYKGEI